ncbi:MAG: DUF3299 domain-containing protein [Proteobacteria bacterium]|jgi:hypothetical protein|nr:DUF3299 domain-containing protein [Pseudomonadota bacterium]
MKTAITKTLPILLLTAVLIAPTFAAQVRELGWRDLIKKVVFEDPFESLTPDQLGDLGIVARVRLLQARGREVSEGTVKEMEEATLRLEKAGVDIDGLLAKRAEIRELRKQRAHAVVEDLNGRQVRMPGYALPLEYSGTQITEFLLVPWVGACIHTPPPPPNQIVYVKLDEGIENQGRFTPMWVTGEMTVKAATKNLYLVDGSSGIDVGYSLEASQVEPYKK